MLELLLCSSLTILPDFLYRRFAQGKRLGREITLFSVWYELRWGITLCVILTISLITTIFYFHPSTTSAVSVFRTVTILPETNGRVAETFVGINEHVTAGQPLFRLDTTQEEAELVTAQRKIAEVEADMMVATSQLAEAEGRIVQARGALKQADDEYQVRAELMRRNASAISQREVDRALVAVDTAQGAVDAAMAGKAAVQSQIDFALPAAKASAEAELAAGPGRARQGAGRRRHRRHRPAVRAPRRRRRQPDAPPGRHPRARPPRHRARRRLRPDRGADHQGRHARRDHLPGDPLHRHPDGGDRRAGRGRRRPDPPDRPVAGRPDLRAARHDHRDDGAAVRGRPRPAAAGSACIANAYTSNHDALQDPEIGAFRAFVLHAIDATGLVHAALLRMQALILPVRTLVLSGGH